MKTVIQIVLVLAILGLSYVVYDQVTSPVKYQNDVKAREAAVIGKIKDIRTAERAYKQKYSRYTGNFDTLINFILNDSLVFERSSGSQDDSVAVARGLVKTEKFNVAVIDTIFSPRKLTIDAVRDLRYIPYSNNTEFILNAGTFETESKVVVPVFECKAPYKLFLADLDQQELINLIDERKVLERYPGIKVGAMDQATNDAGNWE